MFYNVFSPCFQVNHRMNQVHPEMFAHSEEAPIAQMLKEDPAAVKVALDLVADYTEKIIDAVVGAGIADGIYFSVSCFNRGIEHDTYSEEAPIAQMLKEDPAAVKVALDLVADYTEKIIDAVVGAGIADGIYFSVSCFNRGIEHDTYRTYVTPGEHRIIAKANSLQEDNLLHICGWRGMRNDLSIFDDYDFSVINWAVHAEHVSVACPC